MRALLWSSFFAVASLVSPAAQADTFTAYSYGNGNNSTPIAIDDMGNVLIQSGNGVPYSVWNAGVQLYSTSTYPTTFAADNGTSCGGPFGVVTFGTVVCNDAFQVYSTDGRNVFEIYPGSPLLGTEIQGELSGTYDGPVLLNAVGDIAFVDGRDEVQREIIRTATAVGPEPTSLGLFGTGLLSFFGLYRRRAQHA